MNRKVNLSCSNCGSRNYSVKRNNSTADSKRLEVKKYCRYCNKHTTHKETK